MTTPTTAPTLMQKAVTPQLSAAYLDGGYDRVAGFVVRADTVAAATTAAELVEVHGLTFPGSPWTADSPHVDVLRFRATPQLRFEDAIGGVDAASRSRTGGPFLDRPPFTGTGFVATGLGVVPLYWLVHSRIPAGAELVRVGADGTSTLLATYVDVGHGWRAAGAAVQRPLSPVVSRFVGPLARWQDGYLSADPLDDGTTVLVAETRPADELGFEQAETGRWRRLVPTADLAELFEMSVTGTWNGLPVRVVDQWKDGDGTVVARVSCTGHDADLAEGLRLQKVDAAVYEATVPLANVTQVQTAQLVPRSWQRG
jgi:hypothetical protein